MPIHPVIPVYRLTFPYIVQGFSHVQHLLMDVVASADASGFDAVVRAGFANPGVSTIPVTLWSFLGGMFGGVPPSSFGNAHLDHFSAGAWIPIWYETNAVTPTSGQPQVLSNEFILSGYSTLHEKMKVILMEPCMTPPYRRTAWAAEAAYIKNVVNWYFNVLGTAVATSGWAWMRSRDDSFAGTLISGVDGLNRRLRRKRGFG